MKRAATLFAIFAMLMSVSGPTVLAGDKTRLEGEFYWDGGATGGDLEAVFTPTKTEGLWDVAFHFEFRGKSHTYKGSAEGSLTSGDLEGTVQNEKKKRTFTFSGSITDGKFSGTHAETHRGRSSSTGTLELAGL